PGCPLQGYFYEEAIDGRSLKSRIEYEFSRLKDIKTNFLNFAENLNESAMDSSKSNADKEDEKKL
ncbi:hypothetical protein, partial [Traorella massiliensis]